MRLLGLPWSRRSTEGHGDLRHMPCGSGTQGSTWRKAYYPGYAIGPYDETAAQVPEMLGRDPERQRRALPSVPAREGGTRPYLDGRGAPPGGPYTRARSRNIQRRAYRLRGRRICT